MGGRAMKKLACLLALALTGVVSGQSSLEVDGPGFKGTLHDNFSNRKRQGSGFTPLILKSHPGRNLFRDDAVGLNFEHIFNGARAQHGISMFTPRRDPCHLKTVGKHRYEISWPSEGSKWGLRARMVYDLSIEGQVDMTFECTPTRDLFPRGYVAMMWASIPFS